MTDYEKIEKVIRYLEANYRDQPSLAKLAKIAGASEFHFHRLFTRWAGTSPKSFLQYLTAKHAQRLLLDSKDLLTTAFDAGLSGPGRLHDLMISVEAVTPGEFKAKGSGVEIKYGIHECPFGLCLIAMTKRGVCHLAFIDAKLGDAVLEMKQRFRGSVRKTVSKRLRQGDEQRDMGYEVSHGHC
jgi:AraC family transcriptional regulator of adaptative response/methylated-DNA-[protein]-cysteine methyltransferase